MEFTDNPDDQLEDRKLAWSRPFKRLFTNLNAPALKVPFGPIVFAGSNAGSDKIRLPLGSSVFITVGTGAIRFGGTATGSMS